MTAPFAWIRPEPHGIHVVPANCWIDPSRPVDNALVTHGHADHARGGHGRTIATPETLAIMELRCQTREGGLPAAYGETIRLPGEVDVTFVPAGHVLGSAQIVLEHAGERVVVTGDYTRSPEPTCPPFEVVPCDVFVTEATFGAAGVSSNAGASSLMLTCTSPPLASLPNSSSSASGCLILSWINRAIGRAPIALS